MYFSPFARPLSQAVGSSVAISGACIARNSKLRSYDINYTVDVGYTFRHIRKAGNETYNNDVLIVNRCHIFQKRSKTDSGRVDSPHIQNSLLLRKENATLNCQIHLCVIAHPCDQVHLLFYHRRSGISRHIVSGGAGVTVAVKGLRALRLDRTIFIVVYRLGI